MLVTPHAENRSYSNAPLHVRMHYSAAKHYDHVPIGVKSRRQVGASARLLKAAAGPRRYTKTGMFLTHPSSSDLMLDMCLT